MEDKNSLAGSGLKRCVEMDPESSLQFKRNDGEDVASSLSSTHSSVADANFHTLKINLKEMMKNLSEMTNFLDNEEVIKEKAAPLQHPSEVCDASKSDEMKLNEILNLLHHLTRTLTAYEKSPLLAELPSRGDVNRQCETIEILPRPSDMSNCNEDFGAQNINLVETKSLRKEIDGIILRKEALDEKMESFRRASTAIYPSEPVALKKISVCGSSSDTAIHSHEVFDDLKREDEMLGLSDGGLSGEINSLGETIQHLLNENKHFRSFFNTIVTDNQIDDSKKYVNYLSNDFSSQFPTDSHRRYAHKRRPNVYSNCKNNNRDIDRNEQISGLNHYKSNNSLLSNPIVKNYKFKDDEQGDDLFTSGRGLNQTICYNSINPEENTVSSQHKFEIKMNSSCATASEETDVFHDGAKLNSLPAKSSSNSSRSCNRRDYHSHQIKSTSLSDTRSSTIPIKSKSDGRTRGFNKLKPGIGLKSSKNSVVSNLLQLSEAEAKVNILIRQSLTFKHLLDAEHSNLARGDNFEDKNRRKVLTLANELKKISYTIYSSLLQSLEKDGPCNNMTCRYQIDELKNKNKLLQNQLALQIGLSALVVSPNSMATSTSQKCDNAIGIKNDGMSTAKPCNVQEINSTTASPVNNNIQCPTDEVLRQETVHETREAANIYPNEKMCELQKLVIEERLKGQLWFAAEKATSMRLIEVEQSLRKVKQSRRELQAKYKNLRQVIEQNPLHLSRTARGSHSEKSYEIMLTTLGQNIGIAAEIVSSHLYFSKFGIHPSPELRHDPTFWFAAQCSRLRWLQGELRQLCIYNWKNTTQQNKVSCDEEELTEECATLRDPHVAGTETVNRIFAQKPQRRLSLPECGNLSGDNSFLYGSWPFDLNHSNDCLQPTPLLKKLQPMHFISTNEKDVDVLVSEFCNSTYEGISEISASSIREFECDQSS